MENNKRILIVDDDKRIRNLLIRCLRDSFSEIFDTESYKDAQRILESNEISNVICDFDLGENSPNGFALVKQWRHEFPNIQRAVIFTGHGVSKMNAPHEVDFVADKGLGLKEQLPSLIGEFGVDREP